MPYAITSPQKAEEKLLKKLLSKLQEETKPPCETTAKKELEEVCLSYRVKALVYMHSMECKGFI